MVSEKKEDVDWMYQGPESIVNKEDYLLGKRLDKNFQLFSGDIAVEKNSKFDTVTEKSVSKQGESSQGHHGHLHNSLLDLETVRKEDPLVAIKVREAKVRQEILDNPIRMKRLQKIVKGAMLKKMKKMAEEMAQQDSDSSSSSSSSSEEDSPRPQKKKHHRNSQDSARSRNESRRSDIGDDGISSANRKYSSKIGRNERSAQPRDNPEHRRTSKEYRDMDSHDSSQNRRRRSPDAGLPSSRQTTAGRGSRQSSDYRYNNEEPRINNRDDQYKEERRGRNSNNRHIRRRHDSSSSRSGSPTSEKVSKSPNDHRNSRHSRIDTSPVASNSRDNRREKRRSPVNSRNERNKIAKSSKRSNDFDYSASDSDEDRRRKKFAGSGLVKPKKSREHSSSPPKKRDHQRKGCSPGKESRSRREPHLKSKQSSKKLDDYDYSASDSDDERRKKKFAGSGLVKPKKHRERSDSPTASKSRDKYRERSGSPVQNESPESSPKKSSKKLNACDYSASDSDDDRRKKKFAGYGLVKTQNYRSPDRNERENSENYSSYASRIPAALAKFNPSLQRRKQSPEINPSKSRKPATSRMTDEEKKQKLEEMSENAKWREEQRAKNVRNLEAREEWEAREEEKGRGGVSSDSFIQPMLAKVSDTSSVESRIKSKRHGLQRGPGDMEKNFARR